MIGLMQIMIYLFCIYLVYKGIEIFQIAYMSSNEKKQLGVHIGIVLIIIAVFVSGVAIYLTEDLIKDISSKRIPNF